MKIIENQLKSTVKQLDKQAVFIHKQRQQVLPDLVQQLEAILVDLGMALISQLSIACSRIDL